MTRSHSPAPRPRRPTCAQTTVQNCQTCGAAIPRNSPTEAFCVRCRYSSGPKAQPRLELPTKYDIALEEAAYKAWATNSDQSEASVEFNWPEELDLAAAPDPAPSEAQKAFDALRAGLRLVIEGGRRDGIPSRAAALAVIVGLFNSPAAAAERIGSDRKTVERAVETMQENLKAHFAKSQDGC